MPNSRVTLDYQLRDNRRGGVVANPDLVSIDSLSIAPELDMSHYDPTGALWLEHAWQAYYLQGRVLRGDGPYGQRFSNHGPVLKPGRIIDRLNGSEGSSNLVSIVLKTVNMGYGFRAVAAIFGDIAPIVSAQNRYMFLHLSVADPNVELVGGNIDRGTRDYSFLSKQLLGAMLGKYAGQGLGVVSDSDGILTRDAAHARANGFVPVASGLKVPWLGKEVIVKGEFNSVRTVDLYVMPASSHKQLGRIPPQEASEMVAAYVILKYLNSAYLASDAVKRLGGKGIKLGAGSRAKST